MWSAFYTEHSERGFFKRIMDGDDPAGMQLLLDDIDAISFQLKRLQDAGVPILWRPLHEASGGWFWWGTCRESNIKLWKLMYDRMTNHHGLNNLIWVWNGQHADWYPGDDYVDIIGEDIYPGERVRTSQADRFVQARNYTDSTKIIAMTENGCLYDPDLAKRDGALWLWWCVWNGEFTTTDRFNEFEWMVEVYNHPLVLTWEDLPDLKNYPIYED